MNDASFRSCVASTKAYLSAPGVRAMWRLTRDWYEPSFRDFLDKLMADVKVVHADRIAQWQMAVAEQGAEVRSLRAVRG